MATFEPANGPAVHSLDHFCLTVPDRDEARTFYSEFGLDVRAANGGLELFAALAADRSIPGMPDPKSLLGEGTREQQMQNFKNAVLERVRAAAALVGTEPVHLDHPQRHFINAAGQFVELRYGVERPGPIGTEAPTILTAHEDPASVKRLADLIVARNPEAVLVHGMVMTDMEHVGTCLLTTKAYWKAAEQGYQGMLLHWHDVGAGLFGDAYGVWDTHIDVTDFWQRKLDWIGVHACMIPTPSEIEYASRDVVRACAQPEVFNIVSRGRRYFDSAPFGAEIRMNRSR